MDRLKALDPNRPIREADIAGRPLCANRCQMHRSKQRLLVDQLVGAAKQRQWNGEAERPGSFEIDDQFKLGWLLDR